MEETINFICLPISRSAVKDEVQTSVNIFKIDNVFFDS